DKIVFWDDSASKLTHLATVGPTFDGTTLRWPVELVIACSDESTNLTTGTAKVTFRAPYAFLLTGVRASVNTAPTGSTVKFVPPVIKKDEEVQEEEQKAVDEILDKKEDIGTEDKKGNDEAPPTVDEAPSLDPVIEAPKVEEKTYEMFDIQKEPSFPGGQQEMYKWLAKNVEYPEMAKEAGISGQAVVTFVVGKDGSIKDVAIVKDPGGGCGKAVKATVEKMPKWSPGEANGHPVKVRYTLPFKFKLE
ncbi:MAG TPA: hypothetical protein DCF33_14975, partial [Saprospirales bacterium]|nr:hypothetical protein [Saprospirales bacterium]